MRCPKDRVVLITKNGGLGCPKRDYTVRTKKTEDLRVYNKYVRRNTNE